jgi:hypothetical protein
MGTSLLFTPHMCMHMFRSFSILFIHFLINLPVYPKYNSHLRTEIKMKMAVSWVVAPCSRPDDGGSKHH